MKLKSLILYNSKFQYEQSEKTSEAHMEIHEAKVDRWEWALSSF